MYNYASQGLYLMIGQWLRGKNVRKIALNATVNIVPHLESSGAREEILGGWCCQGPDSERRQGILTDSGSCIGQKTKNGLCRS